MRQKSLPLDSNLRYFDNVPLLIATLLTLDSLHFIFAGLLLPYLPPATSSMFMLGVATVEMAVFLAIWDRIQFDVLRRHLWFFLSIGVLIGVSTWLTFVAVIYIDPGTASLLGKSSLIFGVAFGLVWLKERLTLIETTGAVVAIVGLFIVTFQPGDYLRWGSLIAIGSAVTYALHTAIVKRYGDEMRITDFFLFRVTFTTGFLVLLVAVRREFMWPSGQAWLVLILAGTLDIVLSRGLYYVALRRLKLSLHSIILTLSPVATIGWTILLFNVLPTAQQLIGGAAIIAGVIILSLGRPKRA